MWGIRRRRWRRLIDEVKAEVKVKAEVEVKEK